jgi:hypothetical protein
LILWVFYFSFRFNDIIKSFLWPEIFSILKNINLTRSIAQLSSFRTKMDVSLNQPWKTQGPHTCTQMRQTRPFKYRDSVHGVTVFIESSLIKGRNSCIQDSKILFKQFFFFLKKKKKKPFQVACIGGISHQSVMEKISTLVKKKEKKIKT